MLRLRAGAEGTRALSLLLTNDVFSLVGGSCEKV